MMVPDTSTILAKQDFAAFSTVTAAPLAGTSGSSAAKAGQENRQNIPAAIRGASLGERSRARMVIGISFPVLGVNRYQNADRSAKRQECHPSARTAAASVASSANGTPASSSARAICLAIAGLIDDAWVSGSI